MDTKMRSNLYISVDPEEEIVISGIAGRFPNSDNLKEFKENLLNKMDLGTSNHERWNKVFQMPERIGKINNLEKFDSEFFNMSATETNLMDSTARIMLEHTYEAIIDAGVNPKELQGTKTSVIVGCCFTESHADFFYYKPRLAGLPVIGTSKSFMANRISYWLNVTGPSFNIDTACSSSQYAIVTAYEKIRSGECDAAIVIGTNLCLYPHVFFQFYKLGVLSSDGYCKPFDKEGTGYMRSDAIVVIYLQKAKNARRVYATFVYGKTNCDGFKDEGITFPSLDKQTMLLKEFYEECKISPAELSYVEAHGTGTIVGDSVEIASIDKALCAKRISPLLIGSVKSNIGHSEASSSLCQIVKVLLGMEAGLIMPTIHFKCPRDNMVAIHEGRIKIVTEVTKFEGGYIGVNSFGFGGANSHVLLKSNPKTKVNNSTSNDNLPILVAVSGRTKEAIKIILDDIQNRPIDAEYISLLHCIHRDNIENHPYRGYTIIGSKILSNATIKLERCLYIRKPICFIFSGLGTQWLGMSETMMKFSVFANTIQKCNTILKPYKMCLTEIMTNKNKSILDNVVNLLVGLVGMQIGIVDLLTSIGIVPDFVIGHSIGELICGYADKCLTLEETILSAYFIGLAFLESNIIHGSMAAINISYETIKNICPSDIQIACYNSNNFIVSGATESIHLFLAKLQADNISVKEIFCGHVPFHSRYVEPAKNKLLKYLNQIMPEKRSRSSKWLTTSAHESDTFLKLCSAKYYTNYLLSPVLFAKAIDLVPEDAVTIEISPQNILHCILKKSVTNISLYTHTDDVEMFLQAIGELYNAGLQPQIANLYPTAKFPVSRGTPMISPLIRWNHSQDHYVMRYTHREIVDKRAMIISINTSDEDFIYMADHVIDGKNLLPATGYLFHIWKMMAMINKQQYTDMPIYFENVRFLRATVLFKQKEVDLILVIQKDGNFEITEEDNVVVTGIVRVPNNVENEKICYNFLDKFVDDEEEMSRKDIYKELRLRGYQYTGVFRGLKSASVTGKNGHIAWTGNWVAFMDNMLQMMILGHNSRSLFVPTRIRKFIIDPKYHVRVIENLPIEKKQFLVRNYKIFDTIVSGGIEIHGAAATAISRRKTANALLEENKFVAHCDFDTMLLQDAIRMSTHIALECYNSINIKIIELIEDSDQVMPENINSFHINKILDELPQIRQHIKLVAAHKQFQDVSFPSHISIIEPKKLTRGENCLMVICFGLLTKNRIELYEKLLSLIMPQGFVLTLENLDAVYDYSHLNKYKLRVILEKKTNEKTLILLRKTRDVVEVQQVLHLNNREFSWVENLKSLMNVQNETNAAMKIILVAEQDYTCGILGLVNCLRKEPGGEIIRSVFIQDGKAPIFSLQEPLYSKQLQLNLPINVLRNGNVWGSYRHFPLPLLEPKLVETAYVSQRVYGDLSTLCWMQGKTPLCNENNDVINVVYSSINFRDIMVATGRLVFDFLTHDVSSISLQTDDKFSIGLEFVGFNSNGQRIMGMCQRRGMTNNIAVVNQNLQWIVPDKWTMEDAATVPCVYSTCYDALFIKGKMKKGDKILIHSGTGGIGQAAIYLALYEGCEVFTTVGTAEKRQFIKETFSIPDDHIGNSRDTSFKEMIMQQTEGRGVDIVLNSLVEEKLQASVCCLAKRGRFLEIGKYDMLSDNPLDMALFSKGISVYSILLDNIFYTKTERKKILHKMIAEGLENGAIKPLCKKIFERDEVEAAFRYMAAGKHIGKIILKIHKDDEHLNTPILAHPRYYCLESKSYIILGGLGGFGLELADWLIQKGAKNLVLTSRNGISNGYQRSRVKLWQSYDVNVQIFIINNIIKEEECESILKFAEKQGPVDAIFNLAVVLNDCIFKNQSPETFENSFKPKAWTTKKMDELSRIICPQLRHFVVFSSVSCGRGNTGQTNYGMANSVMERICEKRMEEGLHGLAIQWGAIGDVGLVADMQEDNKEFAIGGTLQQKISSCLDTLENFLLQNRPIVSSMIVAEKSAAIAGTLNILETVAHIMGLKNLNTVAPNVPLSELGMDSMMAVEIQQTLEREFDVTLTALNLRTLNFAKLKQMANATETKNTEAADIDNDINHLHGLQMLMRAINEIDLISDIVVELPTRKEVVQYEVFLLPGIEGCATVYKSIAPKIKPPATCLQHSALNIPGQTRSVINSASHLLPYILEKMKDQKEFLIVGYSFGALIAIELTRLLEAKNFTGRLILIDGTPNQMKFLTKHFFDSTSQQELENLLLVQLMEMYCTIDKELLLLDLGKQSTWKEKLDICNTQLPKEVNIDKLKLLSTTIYDHIIAIQNYEDLSSLSRLKSSIILFKATFGSVFATDEKDYGLHKVTEGEVQVLYVEGTHITIVDSEKIISAINGELIEG